MGTSLTGRGRLALLPLQDHPSNFPQHGRGKSFFLVLEKEKIPTDIYGMDFKVRLADSLDRQETRDSLLFQGEALYSGHWLKTSPLSLPKG